jgi:hypothetical protein
MSEAWFSDNYGDMSVQSGVNAGFQFEFYCERCHDAYRTPFQGYKKAQAAGWLGQASGLLGGVFGSADNVTDSLAQAGWKTAWDKAFQESVANAKGNFKRCAKCYQYVCSKCFNPQVGLCFNCAPDPEVEMQAAKAAGMVMGVQEVGTAHGYEAGKKVDTVRDRQLVCPECNAETHGAKFCPECGHKMAVMLKCSGCGHESDQGTKFCPECGQKL